MKCIEPVSNAIARPESINKEVAELEFQTSPKTYSSPFTLTPREPIAIISGVSGSGKTKASMYIARQHIMQGKDVIFIPRLRLEDDLNPRYEDMAINLIAEYPDKFRVIKGTSSSILLNLEFAPGTLFILDEFDYFCQDEGIFNKIEEICVRSGVMLIVGQAIVEFPNDFKIGYFHTAHRLIGMVRDS